MIRVAAYCRVSTDRDDQVNSFESQQRFFQNYIERRSDWLVQHIYADEGLSGTSTKKRTQFNRMIGAARRGEIDLIVTKEVSRFARNTVDTLNYTRALKQCGVGVLFLLDNIDTRETDGELRLSIMATLAQEESRKTSERVKWGQRERMKQGVVFGGSLLGYKVKNGQISIDPAGAETVRLIFSSCLEGRKGSGAIAKMLCKRGVPSSRGNRCWSAPTVLKILKNEKYCGDLVQRKTYTPDYLSHEKKSNRGEEDLVILRNHHQPIIERERWEAVQRELARRRTGSGSGCGNRRPLSGKIVCGECGSSFVARTRAERGGGTLHCWRCGKAVAEGRIKASAAGSVVGCAAGRQLREDTAIALIQKALSAIRFDRAAAAEALLQVLVEALRAERRNSESGKRRLEQELERLRERKTGALNHLLDRTISAADFQFYNERCDRELTQKRSELDAILAREKSKAGEEGLSGELRTAIENIVFNGGGDAALYASLLETMTVFHNGDVVVQLQCLPPLRFYPQKRQVNETDGCVPVQRLGTDVGQ